MVLVASPSSQGDPAGLYCEPGVHGEHHSGGRLEAFSEHAVSSVPCSLAQQ